jgi:PAS domain S-box-containing protein
MDESTTVLHIDDEPDLAAVVAEMLERKRDAFEVLTEYSGEDALDRLREADVDCVVSDYDMAAMDGLDLLDAVRAEYDDLPFILYTGHGSEEIASEAVSAGVTDYVQKRGGTEQYEVLAKRVENAVERYRAQAVAETRKERNRVMRDELRTRADELSRYERLVETMNDGAYMLDEDGVINATNDVLTLLTGYTRDELVGQHVSAFMDEEAVERGRECIRSLLSEYGPEVEVFEAELDHASGDMFPAEITISLLPYDDEFQGTIGVVRDVTSREHAKARLREERRKIKTLHEVATAMEDCESRREVFELVVETAETVLAFDDCLIVVEDDGVLVPEVVSEGLPPSVTEATLPVGEDVAGRVYESDESRVVADVTESDEARVRDDDYRSVLTVPMGDVGVFQAVATDEDAFDERDRELADLLVSHAARTAESLAARAELATSEEKYRTVVEESRDPMAILRDGEIAFVNRAAVDLFEMDPGDLVGTSTFEIAHDDDHDAVEKAFGDCEHTGTVEVRLLTADGPRHHEVSARKITYEGERAVLCTARDITERVEAKRELQRQNQRLEEFASVVSHDLRNPLTVALTALDAERKGFDPDALDRVEDALRRMEQLIDDLLALAREGDVNDVEPVALEGVARRAWRTVATGDATLEVADTATAAADASRLASLFENLFRNAVEHAGPEVRVEVGTLDEDAREQATAGGFYVADDGPGIPESERDAVFDHGYTIADDGTGFGLSIVETVASAHGWDLRVTEGRWGGARFEVSGVETGA